MDDVVCFQSRNHVTYIVLEDIDYIYNLSIEKLQNLLPLDSFIRIHRNTIINVKKVKSWTSSLSAMEITMRNGLVFHVPRARSKFVRDRLVTILGDDKNNSMDQRIAVLSQSSERLYVCPDSFCFREMSDLETNSFTPIEMAELRKQPTGVWLYGMVEDVCAKVKQVIEEASEWDEIPLFVISHLLEYFEEEDFNFAEYGIWIREVSKVIAEHKAIFILEPWVLAMSESQENLFHRQQIIFLLKDAIRVLKTNPHTCVYLDAGHIDWLAYEQIACNLARAGIDYADGFSLNVGFVAGNQANIVYGEKISSLLGRKHFIIDTSCNGDEEKLDKDFADKKRLGIRPTFKTHYPLLDAYFWLRAPKRLEKVMVAVKRGWASTRSIPISDEQDDHIKF